MRVRGTLLRDSCRLRRLGQLGYLVDGLGLKLRQDHRFFGIHLLPSSPFRSFHRAFHIVGTGFGK